MCCAGRCASCCSDVDCEDMSECHPGQCWDGACRHDRPFSSPAPTGAVEVPGSIQAIRGMGSLVVLQLTRTLLVADLRVAASPRFISSVPLPGAVLGIEASPPLLLAMILMPGEADPSIHVIDLSLPRFPRTPVALRLEGLRAADLDKTLLAAVSPGRIHLVDVSAPGDPAVLSRLDIDCPEPVDVEVSGSEAVVACGEAGHVLVDLHDPREPGVAASGAAAVTQVVGAGGRWLLLGRDDGDASLMSWDGAAGPQLAPVDAEALLDFDGERILTRSALTRPPGKGGIPVGQGVVAGCLDGGRIYTVRDDGAGGLGIEIEREADGQLQAEAFMPLDPFVPLADAAFSGRRGVLAGAAGGIMVIDAADPGAPRVDHSFVHEGPIVAVAWTGAEEIAVAGGDGRLVFLDYSVRSAPPTSRAAGGASPIVDMEPAGSFLAVTRADGTLETIEHQGVQTPYVASTIDLAGAATIEAVAPGVMLVSSVADGQAAIQSVPLGPDGAPSGPASAAWTQPLPAAATDGLRLFDVVGADLRIRPLEGGVPSAEPSWVRAVQPGAILWHEQGLWAAGPGGLFLVGDGLRIVQATGPHPHLPASGRPRSIEGGLVLVTDGAVITAATSVPPVHVAERTLLDDPAPAAGLVRGAQGLLLAAGSSVGIAGGEQFQLRGPVSDLDPAAGYVLASLAQDGLAVLSPGRAPAYADLLALDAAAVPDGACVAAGEHGLGIVDLADPARPEIVRVFAEAGTVTEVAVVGLNCYALQAGGGIAIASLVDPGTPKLVGRLEAGQDLSALHVWSADGGLVVSQGRRLVFLDVDEPPAAQVRSTILMDGRIEGLALEGGLAAASGALTWFIDLTGDEPVLAGSYDGPWEPRSVLIEADRLLGLGSGALWSLDLSCLR